MKAWFFYPPVFMIVLGISIADELAKKGYTEMLYVCPGTIIIMGVILLFVVIVNFKKRQTER